MNTIETTTSQTSSDQEGRKLTPEELRNLIMVELVSDNPDESHPLLYLGEDERTEIFNRYRCFGKQEVTHVYPKSIKRTTQTDKTETKTENLGYDWDYIFEPVVDDNKRTKLIELFETIDQGSY